MVDSERPVMTYSEFIPSYWHSHTFRAMGSQITLWLETIDDPAVDIAWARVETLFADNEQALSRFRPESELARLNARCGQWVSVSPLMWDLLNITLALAERTCGYFDPTILTALERAGYRKSFDRSAMSVETRPSPASLVSGSWRDIKLDEDSLAVYLPPGMAVDLGGIAKGYTAQQAVELLRATGPCLVDAGGDLVAGPPPTGYAGWPVAVTSPWVSEASEPEDLFTLWLAETSLATSGIDYRRWSDNGRISHHIINPYTGRPADTDAWTVSILDKEAAAAEAWATATLITGSDGLNTLEDNGILGLVITQDGQILTTPGLNQYLMPL